MFNLKDLTTAFHSLSLAKSYAATIIITFAVTLGALISMFSLNYNILAKPLPFPAAERLVVSQGTLYHKDKREYENVVVPAALKEIYTKYSEDFEQLGLVEFGWSVLRDLPSPPPVNVSFVTPEYLTLIGLPLALGRGFSEEEGLNSNIPVAVISYDTWQKHFAGQPDVLGQSIQVGEVKYKIIGVTEDKYLEPEILNIGRQTQVWLPIDYSEMFGRTSWTGLNGSVYMLARFSSLDDHNRLEQLLANAVGTRFKEETSIDAFFKERRFDLKLQPLRQRIEGDSFYRTLLMLAGTIALLLIACANTINLMLSRALSRQNIMAIQVALGAQRFHLKRAVIAEQMILLIVASLAALGVAELCYAALGWLATDQLPGISQLGFDLPSLVFSLLCALILAWLSTVFIVRKIDIKSLNKGLQGSGKGSGLQVSSSYRHWLLFSQSLLVTILLVACVQIVHQSVRVFQQEPDFAVNDRYEVLLHEQQTPTLNTREESRAHYAKRKQLIFDVSNALRQYPGVEEASFASFSPINYYGDTWQTYLSEQADFSQQLMTETVAAEETYLSMLDVQLLKGRHLTKQEVLDGSSVIVINQTAAEKFGGVDTALGKRLFWSHGRKNQAYEVVGIAADMNVPDKIEPPRLWTVQLIEYEAYDLVLKMAPGQQISVLEVNNILSQITPLWRVWAVHSQAANLANSLKFYKIAGYVSSTLAIIAFGLAFIGIYGVLSYNVRLRKFEIGVRMAIGARPQTILQEAIQENMKPIIGAMLASSILLLGLWFWLQQTALTLEISLLGFILPIVLIVLMAVFTSVLSIWGIIKKWPIYALRNG